MSNVIASLEKVLLPFAVKIGKQPHVNAIKNGFIRLMPLTLAGAMFVLINNVFLSFGEGSFFYSLGIRLDASTIETLNGLKGIGGNVYNGTLGIMSLMAPFFIGMALAEERKVDALAHGYLGQETNGAGGLFKGLRTIPVIFDIVKDVEELCPNAWVINFTNPAGMVTEAVYRHTGFKRFIGVCNIPIGMKMFIRDILMLKDSDDLSIDLFGLNHMVFIKDVLVNGKSRFAELLDGVASGQLKASGVKNIFDLPFSEGLIRSLNLLPCSYLLYYFKQKEMLAIEMGEYYKGGARAQVVQKVEKQLFELYKNPELKVKPKELEQRGGAYYSDAACEVINAIYNDKQAEHYVNIPHHGHIDNIPADWAVEMTCKLGRDGATPHPRITHFDDKVMGLIHTIKGFEIAASNAALSGEFNDVLLALNLSPLVHSDRDAELLAREMILAHEKWLPNFADCIAELKKAH